MARTIAAVIPHFYRGRDRSLRRALNALREQSYPPTEIIVWNNEKEPLSLDPDIRVIQSPYNMGPFARFFAGLTASTDYVFFQDNDLAMCPKALENLITWSKNKPGILSLHGYNIPPGRPYSEREFVLGVSEVTRVNVTLGRAELVPWTTIPRILLRLDCIPKMDDLWFSARCRDMRIPIYVVPGKPEAQFLNLDEGGVGASLNQGHYQERDRVFSELFPAVV